jgi:DNA-binding beta-propeller fold protein YncE
VIFVIFVVHLIFVAHLSSQTSVPEIPYDSAPTVFKMPADIHLGEAAGVATNSKGQIFVYTRTGSPTATLGNSRIFTHGGARLFQFDQNGTFMRELGQGSYGFLFAHAVRVDAEDNIWTVDEAANQIVKFSPEGRMLMVLGRKPEAIQVRVPPAAGASPAGGRGTAPEGGRGAAAGSGAGAGRAAPGAGVPGDNFNRPSDVAWDAAGNIFVADGHGNARIAKFDRNGRFLSSWGSRGSEPGQFNVAHSIATDAQGNVYVADQGNKRIQVFDNNGTFKAQIANVGVPTAICITRGPHQYLYSSHSGDSDGMDDAEIYKIELDGPIVGKFGRAGKQIKEFGLINSIDCRSENELYVGELANWRVQKLTLRSGAAR